MPRPSFQPTEEQRRMVKTLSAFGIPQEQIARQVGIRSAKTLRKHFRKELDRGDMDANLKVISDTVPDGHLREVSGRHFLLAQHPRRLARAATI